MAHFTTIKAPGVGLVEVFRNPSTREWRDLVRLADPAEGPLAWHVDGAFYAWGSPPAHRDLQPELAAAIGPTLGNWTALRIDVRQGMVMVVAMIGPAGETLPIAGVRSTLRHAHPLLRALGRDFAVRRLEDEPAANDPAPAESPAAA